MGLKIGTEIVDGLKIGGEVVGGMKIGTEIIYAPTSAPVDRAGTFTITAVPGGTRNRGAMITFTLTDPDGIRSVTSTTLTARSDGSTATEDLTRQDANTFGDVSTRNNARWRSGSATVIYVDGNGVTATLTQSWAIT